MKYGKIDPDFLRLTVYTKDSSAEALILGDYGESKITLDSRLEYSMEYTHHQRIRIFKKSGYDWATHSFYLHHNASGSEKISSLKAVSYNLENGKVVKSEMEKNATFREELDDRTTEVKFTVPNVKEGSIIEFIYTINSPFLQNLRDWQFQHSIPALWSEYRARYPEEFSFKQLMKGYLRFDANEKDILPVTITFTENDLNDMFNISPHYASHQISYNDNSYHWLINNVPAFRDEPYMNSSRNYMSMIEFELGAYNPRYGMSRNFSETWEKINEQMLKDENFGVQLNRGGFLKDITRELKEKSVDTLRLMVAAYDFVRSSMKWDGLCRKFSSRSLRNAFERKSGSSADINLMLVLLLKELGLDADPIIISTRDNGMLHPAQILLFKFNYVIACARVKGAIYLLDATEKMCPYNMLPTRCINGQGRRISEKYPGWVDLNSQQKHEYSCIMDLNLETDGRLTGNMQVMSGNYAALKTRKEIMAKPAIEDYTRDYENASKGLRIKKFEIKNLDSLHLPLLQNFEVEISGESQAAGNLITINPMLYEQIESNPFRSEERKFPVDYTYPRIEKYICSIVLPAGYVLDEKPADLLISLPEAKGKFIYRVSQQDQRVQVLCTLDIRQALFVQDDYAVLREFYSQIVKKQAEMLVIKKAG